MRHTRELLYLRVFKTISMAKTKKVKDNLTVDHFFRGAFSVDLVLITYHEGHLKLLLQKKDEEPFKDFPGLPGKLILPNEPTEKAVRELAHELIGCDTFYTKQLNAFSDVDRHPLGRVVTFAFYGLIPYNQTPAELPGHLSWHTFDDIPQLSYDHNKILKTVLKRFKKGLLRHPTVFELLNDEFLLPDVINIYEQAFNQKVDAPNFRKQIRKSHLIVPLGKYHHQAHTIGRPAEYYTFQKDKYKQMKDRVQFNF